MARASFTKLQRVAEGDVENAIKQTRWAFTEIAIDIENEADRSTVAEWAASTAYTAGNRVIATSGAHGNLWFVADTT